MMFIVQASLMVIVNCDHNMFIVGHRPHRIELVRDKHYSFFASKSVTIEKQVL